MSELLGLDDETGEEETVVQFEEQKKARKAFATWTVAGKDYSLKLRTATICRLEEKFKCNLLSLFGNGGLPPLAVMLTIIQGAMETWKHKITITDIQNLFDTYCDEGGTQLTLLTDVIMPIMQVSGFFTDNQVEDMSEKMQEAKNLM